MTIGEGAFRYRVDDRWAHEDAEPRGILSSVACDRRGRVYLCSREPDPKILVYDADGARLDAWTHAAFRHPGGIHGISVAADDTLYLTDVLDHVVHGSRSTGRCSAPWARPAGRDRRGSRSTAPRRHSRPRQETSTWPTATARRASTGSPRTGR